MEIGSRSSSVKRDDPIPPLKQKRGGWRAVAYILGTETFEKVASMSILLNLTVYLRTKFNLSGIYLVNVVTIWGGTTNISTIIGAFVGDCYLGAYKTILLGCILSLLGMAMMTLTASTPQLRPPLCPDIGDRPSDDCVQPYAWQLTILFVALGLVSVGGGFLKPCNIAFGADQFNTTTEKGRKQLASFFNWWYLSFTAGLLVALIGVVYVQTYISWSIGYAIPTACFFISIFGFLLGQNYYIHRKPQGSVFVDLARAGVAAFRKRKVKLHPDEGHSYYDPPVSESESHIPKVGLSNRFKCLEKAAVIEDPTELNDQGVPKNRWRLCSLKEVGQLKCLIGALPVWVSSIGLFLSMDQQNTFGILQAMQTNLNVGSHFKIPPAWVHAMGLIALALWILIYERVYIPLVKRFSTRNPRLTMKQRIQGGIIMSILCMVVSGLIEKKRRDSCLKHGTYTSPLTFGYLLPQHALAGLVEALGAVAVMEFLTVQLPETMRGVSGSIFFISLSVANYTSSLIVNIIHIITGRKGKTPWLGGNDLNKRKLDYFYYCIAVICGLNFIYFTFFASKYMVKNDHVETDVSLETKKEDLDRERDISSA